MRYTLTYKYGGFYMDLDAVTLQNLEMYTNVVGLSSEIR